MVYGLIDEKGKRFYTYLRDVFPAIRNAQRDYNWLITDSFCNMPNPIDEEIARRGYCWITGEELTSFARQDATQWIGAVFSGFEKDIPLDQILESPLPVWEHPGFWDNPLTLQHPLATVEIVPWDGCYTLLLSKNKKLISDYQQAYPNCQDLFAYNKRWAEGAGELP